MKCPKFQECAHEHPKSISRDNEDIYGDFKEISQTVLENVTTNSVLLITRASLVTLPWFMTKSVSLVTYSSNSRKFWVAVYAPIFAFFIYHHPSPNRASEAFTQMIAVFGTAS